MPRQWPYAPAYSAAATAANLDMQVRRRLSCVWLLACMPYMLDAGVSDVCESVRHEDESVEGFKLEEERGEHCKHCAVHMYEYRTHAHGRMEHGGSSLQFEG